MLRFCNPRAIICYLFQRLNSLESCQSCYRVRQYENMKKLYNSVDDDGSLFEIEEKLDSKIPRLNDQHINLLTSEIMKTASQKLK